MDSDQLQRQVDDSHPDFTIGFLLQQLAAHLTGGPVKKAEAEPLNTGGFISDLHRFRVHFADEQQPVFSCIFKVPTTRRIQSEVNYDEQGFKELVKWCFQVHNAECRFYSEVAPLLCTAPLPLSFRLPELYVARLCPSEECVSGGFMLMEDLCAQQVGQQVAQVELAQGFSKEQVESTIRALARFHALCLWLPPALVDSFQLEADFTFEEEKLHIVQRLLAMPDGQALFGPWEEELLTLFLRAGTSIQPDQHKQHGLAPVLTHGDFWSNNLFFERADDGRSPSSAGAGHNLDAIIDWQCVYSGTGINDLIRVIFICADANLRREHFAHWLCLYSDHLNASLDQMGIPREGGRERSRQMVSKLARFHCEYELCFQLFLLTNVLGAENEPVKRRKMLQRMADLFTDCRDMDRLFGGH